MTGWDLYDHSFLFFFFFFSYSRLDQLHLHHCHSHDHFASSLHMSRRLRCF